MSASRSYNILVTSKRRLGEWSAATRLLHDDIPLRYHFSFAEYNSAVVSGLCYIDGSEIPCWLISDSTASRALETSYRRQESNEPSNCLV